MLKARATAVALGSALVFLTAIGTASPARADRGFGFHHHPFFFHNHFFFRDRFFFGFNRPAFPVAYPLPAVGYYAPSYYPRPLLPPPRSYYPPIIASGPPTSYPPIAEATSSRGTAPRNCRKFEQPVKLDGRSVMAYGTACQQPDGTWRVIP
jgi:hypothetical protein